MQKTGTRMKITCSTASKIGPRRMNEDSVGCWVSGSGEVIACVADGVGGYQGGDIASQLAVKEFHTYLEKHGIGKQTVLAGAHEADRKIRQTQSSDERLGEMATTLTAIALSGREIFGAHCGDSRASIFRENDFYNLTKDHSEAQRLFDSGELTEEEFMSYEFKHIIESALGLREKPQIDSFECKIKDGDRIIITTDGVHDLFWACEIQKLAANAITPEAFTQNLTDAIEHRGPRDNYSVVALYID